MLTHRNKKPYECKAEGCGKSYCDARSLRRHTENHHSALAMTPSTPSNQTTPPSGLSLSPATASGECFSAILLFDYLIICPTNRIQENFHHHTCVYYYYR